MTLMTHHNPIPFTRSETGSERAFARLRRLGRHWSTARRNRALAVERTDEQLADVGLHRAALTGNVAVLEVPAGLVVKLMSMR